MSIDIRIPRADDYESATRRDFDLDGLRRRADEIERALAEQHDQAVASGDEHATALTRDRLAKVRELRAQADAAVEPMVEAERVHHQGIGKVIACTIAVNTGTLDPKRATTDESARVVAHAAERHLRALLPAVRAAVSGPFYKIEKLATDEDAKLLADVQRETEGIGNELLSRYGSGNAINLARGFGKASNARRAALWPTIEHHVRVSFASRVKVARRDFDRGFAWEGGRTDAPPGPEDLEECFRARRASFEATRAEAARKLADLGVASA